MNPSAKRLCEITLGTEYRCRDTEARGASVLIAVDDRDDRTWMGHLVIAVGLHWQPGRLAMLPIGGEGGPVVWQDAIRVSARPARWEGLTAADVLGYLADGA
jgi:hypothetical protein